MSAQSEQLTDFEQQSRLVLEESVRRIDGRVRSRLNQARQAAVEAAAARRRPFWGRLFTLVPTAGAVAAALMVAMILWHRQGPAELPPVESAHPGEDLELLADGEALDLVQDGDGSGSFYEWAADQSEANAGESDT
jgi:anti-sigma-K factor RskA